LVVLYEAYRDARSLEHGVKQFLLANNTANSFRK